MEMILTEAPLTCVHASLAMLTGLSLDSLAISLPVYFPFPPPYEKVPAGQDMANVCEWAWEVARIGLMPFDRCPAVAIGPGKPAVPIWEDGEKKWRHQLGYGPGLLEGSTERLSDGVLLNTGHMCAWDGERIFDPRGYRYAWKDRKDHKFDAERFWLKV